MFSVNHTFLYMLINNYGVIIVSLQKYEHTYLKVTIAEMYIDFNSKYTTYLYKLNLLQHACMWKILCISNRSLDSTLKFITANKVTEGISCLFYIKSFD